MGPRRKTCSALVPAAACLLLGGCGQSDNDPASAPPAAKPDVIVTNGRQHSCGVALYTEAQGSTVPCNEVASFVRDELRLPRGAIYDLHGGPEADPAETAKVDADLRDAGYRFIGAKKAAGRP